MDKNIYPSDGVYYFEDGGTRLKAEVKNTPTQLRIRLIDDPPYFRDARLDRYMYGTPKKTLVYKKPKLMPNGSYRHQTAHALMVWHDGDFTLYAGREGVPTLFEKDNKQEDGVKKKRGQMEEDTVVIPDWAWDSTIPLSEIIIATESGSTRPGSRGFASWCSLNKNQADKFGINYGMGNPNGAKELLKKVEDEVCD